MFGQLGLRKYLKAQDGSMYSLDIFYSPPEGLEVEHLDLEVSQTYLDGVVCPAIAPHLGTVSGTTGLNAEFRTPYGTLVAKIFEHDPQKVVEPQPSESESQLKPSRLPRTSFPSVVARGTRKEYLAGLAQRS